MGQSKAKRSKFEPRATRLIFGKVRYGARPGWPVRGISHLLLWHVSTLRSRFRFEMFKRNVLNLFISAMIAFVSGSR